MKTKLLISLMLVFIASISQAQTWNGTVNQDWNNPLNWTPNAVPTATSNVTLNGTGFSPKLQGATTIGAFASTAGATLDFNGFSLTVGGINAYTTINSATLINTNAATDIVLNINTGTAGYYSQLLSCTISDHITINVTGNDQFIEGGGLNIFNGNVIINVNGSSTVTTSQTAISQFNGNFNFNRLTAGTSNIFNSGATITGNVNIQNAVGGATNIGTTSANTTINGMVTMNITYPTPSSFTMFRLKNNTTGSGTINVQNSLGVNIQTDTLKVTTLTVQGYEGNAYAYFISNKIDCNNLTIEDDVAYGGGYESYLRQNTITGNTTVNIKGTNTFHEAQSAGQANAFIGNTVFNCQGSGSFYLCQGDKSTFTGNLTVNRTASGYTRLFNAGATITGTVGSGNFVYNNSASGAMDIGHLSNATTIAGTINMNVNLVAISGFSMHRLINQTTGGKINIKNTQGFNIQQDSLKVDSLNLLYYRGNGYAYFYNNHLTGVIQIADSVTYGGGYNTNLQNNTIIGNSVFTIYGSNEFYESNSAFPNTFNGNVTYNCNGSGSLYTSKDSKTTITGNLIVNRTAAGYTRLFANGATIGGNFTYTKNAAGASDIGLLSSKTSIAGTLNMNVTQTNNDDFTLMRLQNLTNGGSISVQNCKAPNVQKDTLLLTSMSFTGYGGVQYAYLYDNQITGNLNLQDVATYTGGYNTNLQNNTVNGNSTFTILGTNEFNEANATNRQNVFNGNVTFNCNGSGSLYTCKNAKSTINGNLVVNRTVAGYTSLFGNGATISGNFSYTKNNAGASDLGTLSSKTSIAGTINMNVTQALGHSFSMHRVQNLTNGGSISISKTNAPSIQQDSLIVSSFSYIGYAGTAYAYFYNNQLTGNLTWSDSASYSGGYNTNFQNNTINGNSIFTILSGNELNESNSAQPNIFNGNVTYNCNGSGSLYTSKDSKTTITGNLTVNRTVAGLTRLFGFGANIGGNFSYTKNALSGGSELGHLSNKTSIGGTVNINVNQTTGDKFDLFWMVNNTSGGVINVSNTRMNISKDSLKVNNFSVTGYGGVAFSYFENNQIEGNLILQNEVGYSGGYTTSLERNKIFGNTVITNSGSNAFNDATVANSGNEYLGNVTYIRLGGALNVATGDTNSYAGNLTFNNSSALPITAELIRFTGNTNTTVTQTGTGSCSIQKLIMNKTSAAQLSLLKPTIVTVSATFNSGYINTTTSNPLIFPDNVNHSGASDNSHVVGCVTKAGNDLFTFPLGNGSGYHPLAITAPATSTDSFQSCIVLKHPSGDGYNVNSKDAALLQIAPYHYWTLNQISGTNSESVSLGWSVPCANTVIANLPGMAVARWNGTQWNNLGNSATSGTTSLGTVTQTGTTANYGVFALATTNASNSWQITSVTASANTVCAGTSTTLTGAGAATYNWQPGNLNGTSVAVTPLTTTTYTVTGTTATGCITTATRTITVNPVPTPNASTDRTHTCIVPSSIIGTAAVAGTTYAWLPVSGLSVSNIAQPVANPTSTTTYTVTATITATGCTATDAVIVTVNKTAPTANAGADKINTCTTPSQIIGTAAIGGNTYTWTPSAGLNVTNIAQPTANPTSTTTYTVTVTNSANGCTATDVVLVTVNKTAPTVGTSTTATTVCSGSPVTITGTGATTYVWQPGGQTTTSINVNPTVTTTYTVTGTNSVNGCTNTSTRLITVNPLPTIGTTTSATSTCAGQAVTITGTGGVSYTWQPGALSGSSISPMPTVNAIYTVTGTNANGCSNTSTRLITVNNCSGINVKLFIEGYYAGPTTMAPVLFNQGKTANTSLADSIVVELRNVTAPHAIVATSRTVVGTNGIATCTFTPKLLGNYYIAVKNKSAIQTVSAAGVGIGTTALYDFSNAITKAFGNNMKLVSTSPNVYAFYSGDVDQDENVTIIDQSQTETEATLFLSGYRATDVDGDGNVTILDLPLIEINANDFIFSQHPLPWN